MTYGVIATTNELLALEKFAKKIRYPAVGRTGSSGQYLSKRRGRGMDFAEVRNYQSGDDIRHMEWRVTARTGRPHVKVYQEELERPVVIVADFNSSMLFGTRVAFKSVIAARLAAIIAWTSIKQGDCVGGLLFSATEHSEYLPRSRKATLIPLIAGLAKYTNNTSTGKNYPIAEVLTRVNRVAKPGSLIVILSDWYTFNEEAERQLAKLTPHNDIITYLITDPLEVLAPAPGVYTFSDGTHDLVLNTKQHAICETYNRYWQNRLDILQNTFHRLKIQMTSVTSELDLGLAIHQTFPRRNNA